jgi:hypothetical protein
MGFRCACILLALLRSRTRASYRCMLSPVLHPSLFVLLARCLVSPLCLRWRFAGEHIFLCHHLIAFFGACTRLLSGEDTIWNTDTGEPT